MTREARRGKLFLDRGSIVWPKNFLLRAQKWPLNVNFFAPTQARDQKKATGFVDSAQTY
jgi:hypothetical protein